MRLSAAISGEPSHVLEYLDGHFLVITDAALDALAEHDEVDYFNIIHEIPQRWEQEWCCQSCRAKGK